MSDVAFVLGGGGVLGACQAGMLRALFEAEITPDVILGTSVGALNGVIAAADPSVETAERLAHLWSGLSESGVFSGSMLGRAATLLRSRTHLHSAGPLRQLLENTLSVRRFADLAVEFQCVAASIERASEQWFSDGDVIPTVLASCAVPGILPPAVVGDEHYVDGGIVNSIPVGRAVSLGARTVFVLHVGRTERPLEPPRNPFEVGLVAFEIARRHRFHGDLAALPAGIRVHVLPTGRPEPRFSDWSNLRYRDPARAEGRAGQAYLASRGYLSALD